MSWLVIFACFFALSIGVFAMLILLVSRHGDD
jgi:hypothetical protein